MLTKTNFEDTAAFCEAIRKAGMLGKQVTLTFSKPIDVNRHMRKVTGVEGQLNHLGTNADGRWSCSVDCGIISNAYMDDVATIDFKAK